MVHLVPMTETEFRAYREFAIQYHTQQRVLAGNWAAADACQQAERQFDQILPEGLATPNQFFYSIEDASLPAIVGWIWFALQVAPPRPSVWLSGFVIHEPFRRQGYGTQALQVLEVKVKDMGIDNIGLHVVGHNHAARALYEKLGYEMPRACLQSLNHSVD